METYSKLFVGCVIGAAMCFCGFALFEEYHHPFSWRTFEKIEIGAHKNNVIEILGDPHTGGRPNIDGFDDTHRELIWYDIGPYRDIRVIVNSSGIVVSKRKFGF